MGSLLQLAYRIGKGRVVGHPTNTFNHHLANAKALDLRIGSFPLDCSIYKEVEEITENWVKQFNEERPHESLGNLTPMEYLAVNQRLDLFHNLRY